jgi:hypothetical protein
MNWAVELSASAIKALRKLPLQPAAKKQARTSTGMEDWIVKKISPFADGRSIPVDRRHY